MSFKVNWEQQELFLQNVENTDLENEYQSLTTDDETYLNIKQNIINEELNMQSVCKKENDSFVVASQMKVEDSNFGSEIFDDIAKSALVRGNKEKFEHLECTDAHKYANSEDASYHIDIKEFDLRLSEDNHCLNFTRLSDDDISKHTNTAKTTLVSDKELQDSILHCPETYTSEVPTEYKNIFNKELDNVFSRTENFNMHINSSHEKNKKCDWDIFVFPSLGNQEGKGNKVNDSKECVTKESHVESVKNHIKKIRRERKTHRCEMCNKIFSCLKNLKVHISGFHNQIKNYNCGSCNKKFSCIQYLNQHVRVVHKFINEFECGECYKTFSTSGNRNTHINTVHKKIKRFICAECHKSFTQQSSLKSHIFRMHDSVKYCKCNVCDKMFVFTADLKKHINKIHKCIKRYKCAECSKGFFNLCELKNHIYYIHRGIKNHICNVCHKMFSTVHHLKTHIDTIHKCMKNFCCEICQRTFSQLGSLKTHINMIHNCIKNYNCDNCRKCFTRLGDLKKHIIRRHEDIKN